jgi:hypothetical protein
MKYFYSDLGSHRHKVKQEFLNFSQFFFLKKWVSSRRWNRFCPEAGVGVGGRR